MHLSGNVSAPVNPCLELHQQLDDFSAILVFQRSDAFSIPTKAVFENKFSEEYCCCRGATHSSLGAKDISVHIPSSC